MTQRSILAGANQTIIIKAGANVSVRGHDSDMLIAETRGRWGLTVERRSEAQIGRARAAVGEHVLFDIRLKKTPLHLEVANGETKKAADEIIEVQMGGSGEVLVPFSSNLKVYAGKDIDVQSIQGQVSAYSGFKMNLQDIYCLKNASAGWSMNLDCQTLHGNMAEFTAGSDLRFHVARFDQRAAARQRSWRLLGSADRRWREIGLSQIRRGRDPGDRPEGRTPAAKLCFRKNRKTVKLSF